MDRNQSTLDEVLLSPGTVRINVQGAFIVEKEKEGIEGAQHDTKGIRLPNHTAVISHVALDVSHGVVVFGV